MCNVCFSGPVPNRLGREYVTQIERRVVLIDGRLAELMIDHGVERATTSTFAVQKIDLDYFDEDGS